MQSRCSIVCGCKATTSSIWWLCAINGVVQRGASIPRGSIGKHTASIGSRSEPLRVQIDPLCLEFYFQSLVLNRQTVALVLQVSNSSIEPCICSFPEFGSRTAVIFGHVASENRTLRGLEGSKKKKKKKAVSAKSMRSSVLEYD